MTIVSPPGASALFGDLGSTAEVLYARPAPVDPLAELLPIVDATTLAEPLDPVRWLSRSLSLAHGRPLLVSGYGGAGKTWAVYELLLAVAAGERRAWGEVEIELSGAVLACDYEMGLAALKWRLQRLAYGRGIDLRSLGASLQASCLPRLLLTDPRAEELLLRACDGKSLVVVDNLAASSRGVDENSSEAAESLYRLNRIGERTGATIVVLAHESKDAERTASRRIRGSSAIHAAVGGGVAFSSPCKGVFKGEASKSSLGPEPEPFFFSLSDCGPIDPATGKQCGIRLLPVSPEELARRLETEREEREERTAQRGGGVPGAKLAILRALRSLGHASRTDVLSQVSGNNAAKSQAWGDLVDEGAVKLIRTEGRKQLFAAASHDPGDAPSHDPTIDTF